MLHRRSLSLHLKQKLHAPKTSIRRRIQLSHAPISNCVAPTYTVYRSLCLFTSTLIGTPQVVFDRVDKRGRGIISAGDARAALEYMGRDVTLEACASWLADKGRAGGGGISFVDFTTA